MRRLTACLALCFVAGCTSIGVAPGVTDSGSPDDAGAAPDAGPVDGGAVPDAGPVDAGDVPDAGLVDAGDFPDAGDVPDAGLLDAGDVSDAGDVDAGPMDAGSITTDGGSTCGNMVVEFGEACDLGDVNGFGWGCSVDCQFDCHADSDCNDTNTCNGEETCVSDTSFGQNVLLCLPGELAAPCSACANGFCDSVGFCRESTCGDTCVDPNNGEQCDFGEGGNGFNTGCETSCQYSCTDHSCNDANFCNGDEMCSTVTGPTGTTGQACFPGNAPLDGTSCGTMATCVAGYCVVDEPDYCGNGLIGVNEQCDLGTGVNGTGVGCSAGCQYDCQQDSDCGDNNLCNGTESCVGATENGQTVMRCQGGAAADPCSLCPEGYCDGSGACNGSTCGDGCTDPNLGESCDFGVGQNSAGSGCEGGCGFSCDLGGSSCDDGNVCNGVEYCDAVSGPNGTAGQACHVGQAPMEGTVCGSHLVCAGGACVPSPPECGNAFVELGEECDLGSDNGLGKGCSIDCVIDCSFDSDCSDQNVCNGPESCVAVVEQGQNLRRCQSGGVEARCTRCATGVCDGAGLCAASTCGDGCVDTNSEACDFGTPNNLTGSGCEPDCSFSCALNSSTCDDGAFCNGVESCAASTGPNGTPGQACLPGSNVTNGTSCGTDLVCRGGLCVSSSAACNNGVLEDGEECDLGAGNGTGQGCTTSCTFECASDASCADSAVCNGAEACVSATVSGQTVKLCQSTGPANACTACPTGICDDSGQCVASACGDGCLDAAAGEQCDDHNQRGLDGCDASCHYEVVTRMTNLTISGASAPSFCSPTTNRFGKTSLSQTARDQLNPILQGDIDDGSVNILTQLTELNDLTGGTDPNGLNIGVITAGKDPLRGAWMGTSPIDWWFLADASTVSNGLPTSFLTATLNNRALKAGPNDMNLVLSLGGSPAILRMRNAQIAATINASTDVPAPPPGSLASGLTVFQTITASATNQGLCGNITVESLAKIPIPEALTSGTGACSSCSGSHTYTYCGAGNAVGPGCNSLLDAMVGGCKANPLGVCFLSVGVITASQPDVPATSGGGITTLQLGSGNKVSTAQTSGNNDAYSSYMTFNANRAHLTGQKCSQDSDCQTGQSCVSERCE